MYEAAIDIEPLKEISQTLKENLNFYSERLEGFREKIEGAVRFHHLLKSQVKDDNIRHEMEKLAHKIGVPTLIEKILQKKDVEILTSTPQKKSSEYSSSSCNCWENNSNSNKNSTILPPLLEEIQSKENLEEDEEDHSKMADSGLGGCDRCEGNNKMTRACSCQSFEDAANMYDKSNNSDDLEDFEGISKPSIDLHSPLQPNAHLHCHASTLNLPDIGENDGFDQKTQKYL